jgi:hypothetical protein
MDIVVHLPSILEQTIGTLPTSASTNAELRTRLDGLSTRLDAWRLEWEAANPNAAQVATISKLDPSAIALPILRTVAAATIELQTAAQALELLLYNASRIYVLQLQRILAHGRAAACTPVPLTAAELDFLRGVDLRHRHEPLLLPAETRLVCQPALEAARLLPFLTDHLPARRDKTILMIAPIAVIYMALRSQPELTKWTDAALRASVSVLRGQIEDLAVFDIFTCG